MYLLEGAGFIGSNVAEVCLERGDRVVVVDEMNDYYDVTIKQQNISLLKSKNSQRLAVYIGDICDLDFISNVFETEKPTHICHLGITICSLHATYIKLPLSNFLSFSFSLSLAFPCGCIIDYSCQSRSAAVHC